MRKKSKGDLHDNEGKIQANTNCERHREGGGGVPMAGGAVV
jgi:hypothetical protein